MSIESQIEEIIKSPSNPVLNYLSTLQGSDNENFWTGSDIADFIIRRIVGSENPDEIENVIDKQVRISLGNAVSTTLSRMNSHNQNSIKCTSKKIAPRRKYYERIKTSFGYRIGFAVNKEPINEDTIMSHNEAKENAQVTAQNNSITLEKVKEFIITANDSDLNELQFEINNTLFERLYNMKDQYASLNTKVKSLTDHFKD